MSDQLPSDRQRNLPLQALSSEARQRFAAALTPVMMPVKKVLFERAEEITHVYFPISGVISLVTPLEDGNIVEVATIGNEGIVGVPLREGGSLAVRAISQVAGASLRMEAAVFLAELARERQVRDVIQSYTQSLFSQIAQAAACNRLHSNEERLSRWLLMSHDRLGRDVFDITHEFLGQMLGSRRATVTLSMGVLQAAGLIRYHRGRVTILDRQELLAVSCECYGVIQAAFDRNRVVGHNGGPPPA
ncbi:MAG: Crp/Fnr family transcriptional regulator [Candidatus Dormibacteria bacterium]